LYQRETDEVKERFDGREKGKERKMNEFVADDEKAYTVRISTKSKVIQVFKKADATLPQKGYKG
jgi:hypothetical protein